MKIVWFVSFDTNPFQTFSIGAAMFLNEAEEAGVIGGDQAVGGDEAA